MKYRKIVSVLVVVVVMSATGCVRVDAGTSVPTFGEQILDLMEAHDHGLVTDEEFRLLRRTMIRNLGH